MSWFGAAFGWFIEHAIMPCVMPIVYANMFPDFLVRFGIRMMLKSMAHTYAKQTFAEHIAAKMAYVEDLKTRKLAECTDDANKQHYEVPAEFYQYVMGPWKKYSCGYWPEKNTTFEQSEEIALAMVCSRAQITKESGPLRVLDMGCGWGSFTLYCATHFPNVSITSVSNSKSQREYIMAQAAQRGLTNVEVITCDINTFDGAGRHFDRVVSVEMMEHVKNYELLLSNVASWMNAGGKMFVHIFTHKTNPFHYQDGWMTANFFEGGSMPSDDLLLYFQRDLKIENHWVVNGVHYEKTSNAWLHKFDKEKKHALKVIEATYGKKDTTRMLVNWRLFFMACAECFGYEKGNQWAVSHYLFQKPEIAGSVTA